MSVAGISSTALAQALSAQQPNPASISSTDAWQAYLKERRPEVRALGEALQSGNLSAAEQAYNNLVALGNTLHGDNPFVRSDRALDFNAIGGALANGNLGQAQQAFTALRDTFLQKDPPAAGGSAASPAAVITLSGNAAPASAANSPSAAVASAADVVTASPTASSRAIPEVALNLGISSGSALEVVLNLLNSGSQSSANGVNTLA